MCVQYRLQRLLLLIQFDNSNSENTAWSHTQGTMLGLCFYHHLILDTFCREKKNPLYVLILDRKKIQKYF